MTVFVLDQVSPMRTTSSNGRMIKHKIVRAMSEQYSATQQTNEELDQLIRLTQLLSDTSPPPSPARVAALHVLHGGSSRR